MDVYVGSEHPNEKLPGDLGSNKQDIGFGTPVDLASKATGVRKMIEHTCPDLCPHMNSIGIVVKNNRTLKISDGRK